MKIILRLYLIAIPLVLGSSFASAQEYFGDFLDKLKGTFIVEAKPRPTFKLETDFRFKDPNGLLWATPAGTEVDGASIPQVFWSLIGGPFDGAYINASVIHDHYCRTKERTAHDTHRNLYYGMRALQVPEWKAKLMHWTVATYGPSWKLERRIVLSNDKDKNCIPLLSPDCDSASTPEMGLVTIPPVDLSDPTALAAAISKTTAIARTLLTSDGEFLDVTAAGKVRATTENIQASSAIYRQVFANKDFLRSPRKLGLLSDPSGNGGADIQPWRNNRIPELRQGNAFPANKNPFKK